MSQTKNITDDKLAWTVVVVTPTEKTRWGSQGSSLSLSSCHACWRLTQKIIVIKYKKFIERAITFRYNINHCTTLNGCRKHVESFIATKNVCLLWHIGGCHILTESIMMFYQTPTSLCLFFLSLQKNTGPVGGELVRHPGKQSWRILYFCCSLRLIGQGSLTAQRHWLCKMIPSYPIEQAQWRDSGEWEGLNT